MRRRILTVLAALLLPIAGGCYPYHNHRDNDGLEDACLFSACLVDTCLLDQHPYRYQQAPAPPPPPSYEYGYHHHGPGCGCPSRWYHGHRVYWYGGHWEYENGEGCAY